MAALSPSNKTAPHRTYATIAKPSKPLRWRLATQRLLRLPLVCNADYKPV